MPPFRAARATTLQLLEHLSSDDWRREGWHTESGRYDAETWLNIYAAHAHDHAAQIRRLCEAPGAPTGEGGSPPQRSASVLPAQTR